MKSTTPCHQKRFITVLLCILLAVALLAAGFGIGCFVRPEAEAPVQTIHASNPAYEYFLGAAAWQMSAEAHALMMQGFHLAASNIDDLAALADSSQQGYHWVEEAGQRKLFLNEKQVAWTFGEMIPVKF